MLSSRERVLCALSHDEPDRVPIFLGTSGVTSILAPAYEQLKTYLGVTTPPAYISRTFQYARLDDEVMERLGSDGRPLLPGPAPSSHRRDLGDEDFVDEWGVEWWRRPGSLYYELSQAPLQHATGDDLGQYRWPDLGDPGRFADLAREAQRIRDMGCAVVALPGVSPFEQVLSLRGMEEFLVDMVADEEFAHLLIDTVAGVMMAGLRGLLDAVGELVDVVVMADDLGTQIAPMISPAMYRSFLKPRHAEFTAAVRARSSAKVFLHSDGNVYPLIPDLIDAGFDVLNPVQISATDMGDTARLKREFGSKLAFCGGIDTGWVLPHGTTADVRAEVRRRIHDLAPGGGYILAAVHCIQPDVPIENVLAMFDEAKTAGTYPTFA